MRVGPFAFRYQGNGATPCQYIDTTRKATALQLCNWTSFSISCGWGATRQNMSKLAAFRRGRSFGAKISGGRGHPPANILIPLERQLTALQLCRWHFLYNETLQQTFRPVLSKLSKTTNLGTLSPFWGSYGRRRTFVCGSLESPCGVLVSVIELLYLYLTVETLQGKMWQDSLLSGGGMSVRGKISGGRGHPWGIFFGFYKTRHILLSNNANCTVLRAVVLTQYRRVTDRQTDRRTELL